MMGIWSLWNAIRSPAVLSEPSAQVQIPSNLTFRSSSQIADSNTSPRRGNPLLQLSQAMEVRRILTDSGSSTASECGNKSVDSSPGKGMKKYAYKGKSVKSNSVGIVEISSVRHAVVGGSILCVGGSHTTVTANRSEVLGDVTTHVKKICTFQQGTNLSTNNVSTSPSGAVSRQRRRSQTRMCRICRKYKDGPRRHRFVDFFYM